MRDSNFPLRKAYVVRLTGISYSAATVPVYYQELPDNLNPVPNYYIILNNVSNNDASTKHKADTFTSMSVTIYTFGNKMNSGKAADFIANEVLQRIYPAGPVSLDLSADNMQCVSTELAGDNTSNISDESGRKYIDRTLIFRHRIFQR